MSERRVNEIDQSSEGPPEEPIIIPTAVLLDDQPEAKPEPVAPSTAEPEVLAPAEPEPLTAQEPTPEIAASEPPPSPLVAAPKRKAHWVRRILIAVALLLFVFPPMLTVIYRVIPPPITILMVERLFQGQGLSKHWRGLGDISPACPRR
jgi:hypothetical protein